MSVGVDSEEHGSRGVRRRAGSAMRWIGSQEKRREFAAGGDDRLKSESVCGHPHENVILGYPGLVFRKGELG